jgi:hypothetical protein
MMGGMIGGSGMTQAEIKVWLDEIEAIRKPVKPRARLVCVDGKVVGDCVAIVSPRDPNWYRNHLADGFDGENRVRRR